jgi:hypothetical protein
MTEARITSLEVDNDVAERRDDTLQPERRDDTLQPERRDDTLQPERRDDTLQPERRDDTLQPGPSERKEKTLHVKRALLPNANDTITIAVFEAIAQVASSCQCLRLPKKS